MSSFSLNIKISGYFRFYYILKEGRQIVVSTHQIIIINQTEREREIEREIERERERNILTEAGLVVTQ